MKIFIALVGALLLPACGSSEEPSGVIPQHQLDAMDKAADVENVLQNADLQRRQQVEE